MQRAIVPASIAITKSFEKCVLVCFSTDGSGTPTIGWGHTRGLTKADVGVKRITQDQADILLESDYAAAADELERQIGTANVAILTDNQYGALCDFCYNEGSIGPTLVGLLKARRLDAVPAEISRYVFARQPDGKEKKLLGLVRRRNAETELWATDEPGVIDVTPSSAETRAVNTPPAPAAAATVPLHRQSSFITACTTAVCAGGAAVQPVVQGVSSALGKVNDQLTPFASNAHVASLQNTLVMILAGASVLTMVLMWLKHRATVLESDGAPNNVARPASPAPVVETPPLAAPGPQQGAGEPSAATLQAAMAETPPAGVPAAQTAG